MPGMRAAAPPQDWFKDTFGFEEGSSVHKGEQYKDIQSRFEFTDGVLKSKANGSSFHVGPFGTPSLNELRRRKFEAQSGAGRAFYEAGDLAFRHLVADTRQLHLEAESAGAVFQAASLFNCLETGPGLEPEDGVAHYGRHGPAQGHSCAAACPAATVFRNYFVGGAGQASGQQVDCMAKVGDLLHNAKEGHWVMRQGYCTPRRPASISQLSQRLAGHPGLVDAVRSQVQVGVHWDTEIAGGAHRVCQVFCSALPMGFVRETRSAEWAAFARALLDGAFDATLTVAAVLAAERQQRVKVYLTLVGGGALENRRQWIADAIDRALGLHAKEPLDVVLVHFDALPEDCIGNLQNGTRLRSGITAVRPSTMGGRSKLAVELNLDMQDQERAEWATCRVSAKIRRIFLAFDRNGDGVIDYGEFLRAMQLIDKDFFTEQVVKKVLADADADGDGVIHYAEFISWIWDEDAVIVEQLCKTMGVSPTRRRKEASVSPKRCPRKSAAHGELPNIGFAGA